MKRAIWQKARSGSNEESVPENLEEPPRPPILQPEAQIRTPPGKKHTSGELSGSKDPEIESQGPGLPLESICQTIPANVESPQAENEKPIEEH